MASRARRRGPSDTASRYRRIVLGRRLVSGFPAIGRVKPHLTGPGAVDSLCHARPPSRDDRIGTAVVSNTRLRAIRRESPPRACGGARPNRETRTVECLAMPLPLVVQKFGGSSLADADRIKRVARRIARERAAGNDLVVIVSAMGDTTDELLGLAAAITDEPDARELDVLLATGEHQSATLVSMALHALGRPGHQPDRPAGRDHHGRPLRPGPDRRHRASPGPCRARGRQGRHRGRLPGPERVGAAATTRSRRSVAAAATPPRWRWPPACRRPAARSSPTSAASTPPTRASSSRARQLPRDQLRGDARAGPPGRPGHAGPGGRARLGQRRRHRGPQLVRGRPRHAHQGGSVRGAAQQGPRARPRPERGQGDRRRRARPAGRRAGDLRPARGGRHQRRHDRPERRPRRRDRPVVHRPAGRAGVGQEGARSARPRARRPRADHRRIGRQGVDRRGRACTTPRATRPGCSGRSPTRPSTSR